MAETPLHDRARPSGALRAGRGSAPCEPPRRLSSRSSRPTLARRDVRPSERHPRRCWKDSPAIAAGDAESIGAGARVLEGDQGGVNAAAFPGLSRRGRSRQSALPAGLVLVVRLLVATRGSACSSDADGDLARRAVLRRGGAARRGMRGPDARPIRGAIRVRVAPATRVGCSGRFGSGRDAVNAHRPPARSPMSVPSDDGEAVGAHAQRQPRVKHALFDDGALASNCDPRASRRAAPHRNRLVSGVVKRSDAQAHEPCRRSSVAWSRDDRRNCNGRRRRVRGESRHGAVAAFADDENGDGTG